MMTKSNNNNAALFGGLFFLLSVVPAMASLKGAGSHLDRAPKERVGVKGGRGGSGERFLSPKDDGKGKGKGKGSKKSKNAPTQRCLAYTSDYVITGSSMFPTKTTGAKDDTCLIKVLGGANPTAKKYEACVALVPYKDASCAQDFFIAATDPTDEDKFDDYFACLEDNGFASYPWIFNYDDVSRISFTTPPVAPPLGTGAFKGVVDESLTTQTEPGGSKVALYLWDLDLDQKVISGLTISYDYYIEKCGVGPYTTPGQCDNEMYLNVYMVKPTNPNPFYDCRFDFVPTPQPVGAWRRVTIGPDTPMTATPRAATPVSPVGVCPVGANTLRGAQLAGYKLGLGNGEKYGIKLNIGDTGAAAKDNGMIAYYDNVIIGASNYPDGEVSRTYDFEP